VNENAAVQLATPDQLAMRTLVDQFAFAQHEDFVRPAYLRETMGDQQGGAAL